MPAFALYDKALALDHQYKETYLELGKLYGNDNQFDKAIGVWQVGLKLDPHDKRFSHLIEEAKRLEATTKTENR